jgi:hypothetical protein
MRRRALPAGSGDERRVVVGPGGQLIMPPGQHFGMRGDDEEGGHGTGQYL